MEWKPGPTSGIEAQTPFCRLDVWENEGQYTALVRGYFRDILARADDLPSEDAAKTWCEQRYVELLEFEIKLIRSLA